MDTTFFFCQYLFDILLPEHCQIYYFKNRKKVIVIYCMSAGADTEFRLGGGGNFSPILPVYQKICSKIK
jgi:hypothetical protein